jgi:preprotein translocase subunit SecA
MDGLREGIGYQSYAQKDPLIEYKFQAFNLFRDLIQNINNDIARSLFRVQMAPVAKRPSIWNINQVRHDQVGQFGGRARAAAAAQGGRPAAPASAHGLGTPASQLPGSGQQRTQVVTGDKVGRNDPCPCGSGKKFKYCCGR